MKNLTKEITIEVKSYLNDKSYKYALEYDTVKVCYLNSFVGDNGEFIEDEFYFLLNNAKKNN